MTGEDKAWCLDAIRRAKYPNKQMQICSELMGCSMEDLKEALYGVRPKKTSDQKGKPNNDDFLKDYFAGMDTKSMQKKYGCKDVASKAAKLVKRYLNDFKDIKPKRGRGA